jgi:hypothetical protein
MAHENDLTPLSARPADLHRVVKERRLLLGRSQADVAADAGVALRTVQRLERGDPMSADTILRVERVLLFQRGTLVPAWRMKGAILSGAVGPRMREQRRARGLTLTQAAEWSRCSAATLSRLERGLLGEVGHWDERITSDLIGILGFISRQRFEDWITGHAPAPRRST